MVINSLLFILGFSIIFVLLGASATFVGMAFGAGWTPCVGPMLGAILTVAASTQDIFKGIVILISYSVGLGIPFFISGLLVHKFFEHFQRVEKYFRIISATGGVLLIAIGILLITGYFTSIVSYFGM